MQQDLTPLRICKLTHQWAMLNWGQSLMSMIALLYLGNKSLLSSDLVKIYC